MGKFLAVDNILDGNLDLGKRFQNVQFSQVQGVVAIDEAGMLHGDQIQPTSTATTSSGRAILSTNLLKMHTNVLSTSSEGTW